LWWFYFCICSIQHRYIMKEIPKQPRQAEPRPENAMPASGGQMKAAPEFSLNTGKESGEMLLANNPGPRNVAWNVAHYMANEMNVNGKSDKVKQIRGKWQSWNPLDKVEALKLFTAMVNYNKPWDHKPYLERQFGLWHADPSNNCEWGHDVWSNIHYGYVGALCGFDTATLLDAAGAAQAWKSKVPEGYWGRIDKWGFVGALDDGDDQKAVMVGSAIAGQNLDAKSLLWVMRGSKSELRHRPISKNA
jgi:hypothetical protein